MKFEIKNRYDNSVIFACDAETLREAVETAVRKSISLNYASLDGASLNYASLDGASLKRASLDGASLNGASLNGASLNGAKGINPNRIFALRFLFDQPGKIRAYKMVDADGKSPMCHNNGGMPITYTMGKIIKVDDSNTDESALCAAGINVATLDWCMKEWQSSWRILIVEFTAADIACIPCSSDGKFRLRKCKVVGEKDLVEIGLIQKAVPT